jgi:predicted MFS family arabinose efflux permease
MALSPFRPWRLAAGGLLALAVAMGIGRFVYTPILPFMAEGIPLSPGEAGLIASANFAGYLLGALAAATPYLRGSRRSWLLAGLALSAVTTLLVPVSAAVPALACIRFAGGFASALVLVFASSVVLERLAEAGESRLSAVHFAGVGVGILASSVIVSALAAAGLGWRAQWIASGLAALAAVPAVAVLVPTEAGGRGAAPPPAGMRVPPRLATLIASYGLFGFGYVITATFLVAIVRGSPAIRPIEPAIWALFGLAAIPSVALWSALGRRIGTLAAYALACLVEAVGVAASVLVPNAAGAVVAASFLGGTFMGLTALGLVAARSLTASDPRRILALMTGAFGLGQIVGPALGGALFDRTGSFTPATLLAALALVAAAALTGALALRRGP